MKRLFVLSKNLTCKVLLGIAKGFVKILMLLLLALRSPTDRSIQGFWIFIYFEYLNEDNMYKGNKVAIGVPLLQRSCCSPKSS